MNDATVTRPAVTWRREGALIAAAHLAAVLWMFQGPLFSGRVPYFRDIPVYYYPNYSFVGRALAQGTWPLWNPTSDAGAPFLLAEPLELALVATLGPLGALRVSPPLHVFLAMVNASLLARALGRGSLGTLTSGTVYGLSGLVLSAANLFELFHALCWAPAVATAFVLLVRRPGRRRAVLLAVLAALQVATLSGEIVLQTALVAVALACGLRRFRHAIRAIVLAGAVALLLCAPVLVGARALLAGTARADGFAPAVALGWSAPPVVLAEALIPQFLGDVHTFTDRGYWAQPFFPDRYPYFVSLYLGLATAILAARSRSWKLWTLALLGLALSLGDHGPLWILNTWPDLRVPFRSPVKFFFLTTVALSLMAAEGIEAVRSRRRALGWMAPGLVLLGWAAIQHRWPAATATALGGWVPQLRGPRALEVAGEAWPAAFLVSGALAVGAALAVAGGRRWLPLAAACVGLDLIATNGTINLSTEPSFYTLRDATARLVQTALDRDPARRGRWFSYGMSSSPGLPWDPAIVARNRDVWLYYLDRQSLLPRTQVLDALEGAGDEDRAGFAPEGATLTPAERTPAAYARIHERLRYAGVRWVLSFAPLPEALLEPIGESLLPEIAVPLRLYALRDPLPRAFWVGKAGTSAPSRVSYEPRGPHEVVLHVSSPPGLIVVLDGYHEGWKAECDGRPVSLMKAEGRYRAVATPGGEHEFRMRYQPAEVRPALAAAGLGILACLGLAIPWRGRKHLTPFEHPR